LREDPRSALHRKKKKDARTEKRDSLKKERNRGLTEKGDDDRDDGDVSSKSGRGSKKKTKCQKQILSKGAGKTHHSGESGRAELGRHGNRRVVNGAAPRRERQNLGGNQAGSMPLRTGILCYSEIKLKKTDTQTQTFSSSPYEGGDTKFKTQTNLKYPNCNNSFTSASSGMRNLTITECKGGS